MNRFHWPLLSLFLVSGTAAATTGPLLDFDQSVGPDITILNGAIPIGSGPPTHIQLRPEPPPRPHAVVVRGLAYIVTSSSAPDLGDALVTTVYGQAYTPVGTGLETTGFNSLSPEIVPVSGETIFGNSGTAYESFWASGPTALSNLSSLPHGDPDFDLSVFQGDPSSVVYVFQTYVPASEFAPVPEPLTMIALGLGITGLGGYIRRRQRRR